MNYDCFRTWILKCPQCGTRHPAHVPVQLIQWLFTLELLHNGHPCSRCMDEGMRSYLNLNNGGENHVPQLH
jgi:hypothetical protein